MWKQIRITITQVWRNNDKADNNKLLKKKVTRMKLYGWGKNRRGFCASQKVWEIFRFLKILATCSYLVECVTSSTQKYYHSYNRVVRPIQKTATRPEVFSLGSRWLSKFSELICIYFRQHFMNYLISSASLN